MFLKKTTSKGKTYLSIVESYWDDGRSKHRVFAQLGCLDTQNKTEFNKIGHKIIELTKDSNNESKQDIILKEVDRLKWGPFKVYHHIWNLFEFDKILQQLIKNSKIKFNLVSSVFNIVMGRIVDPSSKLKLYNNQKKYIGIDEVDLQHLYRCLDFLADNKEAIERHIFALNCSLFNLTVNIVFYDVTTLYFESVRPDSFRNFGYSKDAKFGEVQIVLGLLIDQEGRPVGFDVFPGNTFEGNTLKDAIKKLKMRFKINEVIIVADRGINSKINLKDITDNGYHYIVGSRLRNMSKPIQEEILDTNGYKEITIDNERCIFKIKTLMYENIIKTKNEDNSELNQKNTIYKLKEKLICSWSEKRANKDKKDRERLIEKAKNLLDSPETINSKRGAKKYIKTNGERAPSKILFLDENKIEEDERWDGFYGIQCSDLTISEQAALEAYKNLWRIEESFRVLKSSFETRPIFHWNPKRIKGHLVTCFISFLLERTLEINLRAENHSYSTEIIRESINDMEVSNIQMNGEEYYLRSKISKCGNDILNNLKINSPKNLLSSNDFQSYMKS